MFRIGHLGDLNEPMMLGAIAAVEMALELTGVPHGKGGVAGGDGLPRPARRNRGGSVAAARPAPLYTPPRA